MDYIDTLVVGAGCIGLAIAARLSEKHEVLLVETEKQFAMHTSSRNSEVIHAGIYYPTDSLKATLCVRGKALLYEYCRRRKIPYAQLGKVLVAVNASETSSLNALVAQATLNGVEDLAFLSRQQLSHYAPDIKTHQGVLSPSTGIIDSHQFMLSLLAQLEQHQGSLVCQTQVTHIDVTNDGFIVTLNSQSETMQLRCRQLINAAGHGAQPLAHSIIGLNAATIPEQFFCRGVYFRYHGQHPFKHLIYPMPEAHGLGVHATLDLDGQLKFGPDTEFIDSLDYHLDETRQYAFVEAIRRYWPNLDASKLLPDYTGVRPKLSQSGFQDFVIQSRKDHAVPGLVNLYGIESPGLTASLAIAEYVERALED
ncbi:NAD(P)/FAD-dependent oxidoreductase [Pseudoalteromonas xiamenensis]